MDLQKLLSFLMCICRRHFPSYIGFTLFFPVQGMGLVQPDVIKSSGWAGKALRTQSLYQPGLGKNTQIPGTSFHGESSGEDFVKSCLTMSGANAYHEALVTNF